MFVISEKYLWGLTPCYTYRKETFGYSARFLHTDLDTIQKKRNVGSIAFWQTRVFSWLQDHRSVSPMWHTSKLVIIVLASLNKLLLFFKFQELVTCWLIQLVVVLFVLKTQHALLNYWYVHPCYLH